MRRRLEPLTEAIKKKEQRDRMMAWRRKKAAQGLCGACGNREVVLRISIWEGKEMRREATKRCWVCLKLEKKWFKSARKVFCNCNNGRKFHVHHMSKKADLK